MENHFDYNAARTLKRSRTRWLRWLGQKAREDSPFWTDLLDSTVKGWANTVLLSDEDADRADFDLKGWYAKAINAATIEQLGRLDCINLDFTLERRKRRK
jgi:hypothetical protein